MVASTGSGESPMPRPAAPPSILNQYLTSPSGAPVTTCWILAVCDPAEPLNESFELSASCTADAHSSERYFTPTPSSFHLPLPLPDDSAPAIRSGRTPRR